MTWLFFFLACQPDEIDERGLTELDAPRLLRRISLDLRGVLPSAAELDQVEADPTAIDTITDAYLADPRLESRLVYLFAEQWHTRVDYFNVMATDFGLDPTRNYDFLRSAGEEPLRLMAHIGSRDLPWTDIVMADYSMANSLLGEIFPIDYPEGESGWKTVHYSDGRPAVGVLATNGLWWRYPTSANNMNRSRANAISRLLLCEDYLDRPISFSVSSTILEGGSEEAVQTEPTCQTCHATLDPIASVLFGFWWLEQFHPLEVSVYHPERELMGESSLGVSSAWFGTPIDNLSDLGVAIANDIRFPQCAVQTMTRGLWRRDPTVGDFPDLLSLEDAFIQGDLRLTKLIKAVIETPEYRARATENPDDPAVLLRLLTPDQIASTIEDLTGFGWQRGDLMMLDEDSQGFRLMFGGVDGRLVQWPQRYPGLTWGLTLKRLAQLTADWIVTEQGTMTVPISARPDDAEFQSAIVDLDWRLRAVRTDETRQGELTELWTELEAMSDAERAWAGVISVLLQDPDFFTY